MSSAIPHISSTIQKFSAGVASKLQGLTAKASDFTSDLTAKVSDMSSDMPAHVRDAHPDVSASFQDMSVKLPTRAELSSAITDLLDSKLPSPGEIAATIQDASAKLASTISSAVSNTTAHLTANNSSDILSDIASSLSDLSLNLSANISSSMHDMSSSLVNMTSSLQAQGAQHLTTIQEMSFGMRMVITCIYCFWAAVWVRGVSLRTKPGLLRTFLLTPVLVVNLSLTPLLLSMEKEPIAITPYGGILCIAAWKVLALCIGRGPLTQKMHWWTFVGALNLPVIPNTVFKTSGGSRTKGISSVSELLSRYAWQMGGAVLATWINVQLHWLPVLAHHWLYALTTSLFLGAIMDVLGVLASAIYGIEIAPTFNSPWLITSFGDFWARRWNLTTTYILRVLVYEPIMEGRLIPEETEITPPSEAPIKSYPLASPSPSSGTSTPISETQTHNTSQPDEFVDQSDDYIDLRPPSRSSTLPLPLPALSAQSSTASALPEARLLDAAENLLQQSNTLLASFQGNRKSAEVGPDARRELGMAGAESAAAGQEGVPALGMGVAGQPPVAAGGQPPGGRVLEGAGMGGGPTDDAAVSGESCATLGITLAEPPAGETVGTLESLGFQDKAGGMLGQFEKLKSVVGGNGDGEGESNSLQASLGAAPQEGVTSRPLLPGPEEGDADEEEVDSDVSQLGSFLVLPAGAAGSGALGQDFLEGVSEGVLGDIASGRELQAGTQGVLHDGPGDLLGLRAGTTSPSVSTVAQMASLSKDADDDDQAAEEVVVAQTLLALPVLTQPEPPQAVLTEPPPVQPEVTHMVLTETVLAQTLLMEPPATRPPPTQPASEQPLLAAGSTSPPASTQRPPAAPRPRQGGLLGRLQRSGTSLLGAVHRRHGSTREVRNSLLPASSSSTSSSSSEIEDPQQGRVSSQVLQAQQAAEEGRGILKKNLVGDHLPQRQQPPEEEEQHSNAQTQQLVGAPSHEPSAYEQPQLNVPPNGLLDAAQRAPQEQLQETAQPRQPQHTLPQHGTKPQHAAQLQPDQSAQQLPPQNEANLRGKEVQPAATGSVRPRRYFRRYLALQATFLFSAIWHVLVFWYNTRTISWEWFVFFTVQAPILVVEQQIIKWCRRRRLLLPRFASILLANFLLIYVARPIFFGPVDESGMASRNLQSFQGQLRDLSESFSAVGKMLPGWVWEAVPWMRGALRLENA